MSRIGWLPLLMSCLLLAQTSSVAQAKRLKPKTAAAGLKEALSLGTGNAVDLLGVVDGYLGREEVRIQPPKGLKTVEKGLRLLGQDELVDEFVTTMNRAAEAAAPLAKEVFLEAIKDMSFEDAVQIVRGGDHAATEYLEQSSRERLHELFRPIVAEKLEEVGATAAFNDLVDRHLTLPFASKPAIELDRHVTDGALDGLFLLIAREEERIRTNVVARTSDLLKKVFAKQDAGDGRNRWWKKL